MFFFTPNGLGTWWLDVSIADSLPNIVLPGQPFRDAVESRGRANDGYLLPHCDPVVDSVFVPSNAAPEAEPVLLQMQTGRPRDIIANVCGVNFVFVVPDQVTMKKNLGGGPTWLNQYRVILRENQIYLLLW
jgi:hypothetical protein